MIAATCSVEISDRRWKKLVDEDMRKLAKQCFLVGIPSGAKPPKKWVVTDNGAVRYKPSRINMATLGYIMEKGSVVNNIPPRPFMQQFIDRNRDGINKRMSSLFTAITQGKDVSARMHRIGNQFRSMMQQSISSGDYKENAPITTEGGWMRNKVSGKFVKIAPKRSTKPLMDTGALRQSIVYKIAGTSEGNG